MKKLIYILLLIPFLSYGQDIKKITRSGVNNSRTRGRINQTIDQVNKTVDSTAQHRTELDASKDAFDWSDSTASIRYIDFKLTDGWSMQEGRAGWDDEDKTLEVGLDQGSILQVGQEMHIRGTNKYGATLYNGTPVYVSGAQGSRPTFGRANYGSVLTSFTTIGVTTQDIGNNNNGYVTIGGIVRDIPDSMFMTSDVIADGELLWLGDGVMTDIRPAAPLSQVAMGIVISTLGDVVDVLLGPVYGQRLTYLPDVSARGNQANNHILQWNTDSLFWESRDSLAIGAIHYTDTYWDDLRVPLTSTRVNPVNTEPDFEDSGDGLFAWGFDSDSDSSYVLNFIAQLPHAYEQGTDLFPHIHWHPDGTNTGVVVWKIVYSIANIDGTFSTPDTLRVTDAGDGVALKHQLADFGHMDGTGITISAVIRGNIARMGDAADDTYTGTAYGLEIDFHYEICAPGSRTASEK